MKPHEIRKITETAERLLESESTPVAAFLLSWVAWEALRTRFLRVVIKRQGWSIKDADIVIRASKISSMNQAGNFLVKLGLANPTQWNGESGRVWRKLSEVQQIRHRLAHGFAGLNPELVIAATEFVLGAVKRRNWLESLVLYEADNQKVGDLFTRQPTRPARREADELWALIGKPSYQKPAKLPSVASLLHTKLKSVNDKAKRR